MTPARIPDALVRSHEKYFGREWIDALPSLVRDRPAAWTLTPDGAARCGAVALILPVRQANGVPAVLKFQPVDDETRGEPAGLRLRQRYRRL